MFGKSTLDPAFNVSHLCVYDGSYLTANMHLPLLMLLLLRYKRVLGREVEIENEMKQDFTNGGLPKKLDKEPGQTPEMNVNNNCYQQRNIVKWGHMKQACRTPMVYDICRSL